MGIQKIVSCFLLFFGTVIMLISLMRTKELKKLMPFVPDRHRGHLLRYLLLHRGLIVFFLFGYILVLVAVAVNYSLVSEFVLSIILFFGSIFVFTVITVQSRLLFEVQNTLQGILPICAHCKKIRIEGGDSRDRKAWKSIENYISEKTDVGFSHGYCPECFEEEMRKLEQMP